MRFAPVIIGLVILVGVPLKSAASDSKLYAVIVANNHSLDKGFRPLRFADDDGAKYFELFTAAGAEAELLAVLDPDTENRYSSAAEASKPPKRAALLETVQRIFNAIEKDKTNGIKTEFVFVYSGHGNVGPNREGYINLIDTRFTRSELFREIIAKSPASINHLILDACHSYYLVEKKGGEPDKTGDYTHAMQTFLETENLASYPNTGVILASSKESESHEWSRWEAGIFSHELRSALLGSADVNTDGRVSYAEAAACIEAANSTIDVPKARLRVHYRAPAIDRSSALMDLSRLNTGSRIRVPSEMSGQYHIEDARGVRVADFHFSNEQDLEIALLGTGPFFLKTKEQEVRLDTESEIIDAATLVFEDLCDTCKGSLEMSFRRHLYEAPFGLGFYRGVVSSNKGGESSVPAPNPPAPLVLETRADTVTSPLRIWGWSGISLGLALSLTSGFVYYSAYLSHEEYENSTTTNDAAAFKTEAQNKVLASRILVIAGAVSVAAGITMFIVDKKKGKDSSVTASPLIFPASDGFMVGMSGKW